MYKAGFQIKEIIAEYKQALKALGVNVERVILYGSHAKGSQREDSDIDLVVISNDFRKMNLRQRLEVLGIAAARIMKPIEARGYTPEEINMVTEASFLKEVLEMGVSIQWAENPDEKCCNCNNSGAFYLGQTQRPPSGLQNLTRKLSLGFFILGG